MGTKYLRVLTLSCNEQIDRFETLDEWFHSAHGSYVAKAIEEELAHLNDIIRGEQLVQLGGCADNAWLTGLQFKHKWLFNPQINPKNIHCSTLFNLLPVDRESIDCVIAPFIVDAFDLKDTVIDEIDRILKPMGHVVFLGVNPVSLWGIWLKFSLGSFFGECKGFPRSVLSLKRAMIHRGYMQCYYNGFYFIPPVSQKKLIHTFAFLNQVGKMISPTPSAFYCLVMQKHVENYIEPLLVESKKDFLKSSPAYQPVC